MVMRSGSIPGEGDASIGGGGSSARAIEGGAAGWKTATLRWTGAPPAESSTEARTPPVATGWRNLLRSRALRWVVTLALLAYAISRLSADQIAEIVSWNSVALLLASSAVVLMVVGLNTVRWLLVARICQVQMPWRRSFQWTMIGHFFNQIFPSSIGGDVVRGILAGRGIDDMGGAFSSIALERIVGIVALLTLIAMAVRRFLLRAASAPARSHCRRSSDCVRMISIASVTASGRICVEAGRHPARQRAADSIDADLADF